MEVPKGAIYGLVGKKRRGENHPHPSDMRLAGPHGGELLPVRGDTGRGQTEPRPAAHGRGGGDALPVPGHDGGAKPQAAYRVLGLPDDGGIPELLELVGLSNTGRKKAGHFSLGMKQRLGIAIALCGDPDFLVLDEPINGLDPQGIVEMRELILKLNRERQITVLISSHITGRAFQAGHPLGFIDGGRMVMEVSAQELEAACRKCAG